MVKIIELFAGIGAQAKALENLGIEFESVVCEIDKYAYKSYCAIHGDTPNLGDITKIEKLPEADIWTWSYPCTSVSIAGKQDGMKEGSGTASSLGWEVIRLLKVSPKPKIMLMENVDAVLNKKNKPEFDRMCKSLEELGYTNNYKVLNAKDYGVAQNRKRCFMISSLDGKKYAFPDAIPLTKVLKDYLEDRESIPANMYLKQHQIDKYERFINAKQRDVYLQNGDLHLKGWHKNEQIVYNDDSIGAAITGGGTPHKVEDLIQTGDLHNEEWLDRSNRVYSTDGIATTTTLANNSRCKIEESIKYPTNNKTGFIEAHEGDGIVMQRPTKARGTVQQQQQQPSLTQYPGGVVVRDGVALRIRYLTPRECFRLMSFDDVDFDKCKAAGISNSQLYKQAGNSIVVDVLTAVFKNIFDGKTEKSDNNLDRWL